MQYHPHKEFPHSNVIRERISCMMRVGKVANMYINSLECSAIIWCRTLQVCRDMNPVPTGKTSARVNLHQTKKGFSWKLVPDKYYWQDDSSPRLTSQPTHTMRDVHKDWRSFMFKSISKHANIHLYDADFSSCYVRVIQPPW